MSGTFSVRLEGTLTNEHHTEKFGSSVNKLIPQTGQGVYSAIVSVPTSPTMSSLPTGDIHSIGYIYMKNLSTGNNQTILYGPGGAGYSTYPYWILGELQPSGGEAWFKMDPNSSGLNVEAAYTALLQIKMFEA